MVGDKDSEAKREALRQSGTVHPNWEEVSDPLFVEKVFFDPQDLMQVKYEMVRRVRVEGESVTEAVERFGMSRPSFYRAEEALEAEGLWGLAPRKRGPRGPHKLTAEVMEFLEKTRRSERDLTAVDLARLVKQRFRLVVHPRSIERAVGGKKGAE